MFSIYGTSTISIKNEVIWSPTLVKHFNILKVAGGNRSCFCLAIRNYIALRLTALIQSHIFTPFTIGLSANINLPALLVLVFHSFIFQVCTSPLLLSLQKFIFFLLSFFCRYFNSVRFGALGIKRSKLIALAVLTSTAALSTMFSSLHLSRNPFSEGGGIVVAVIARKVLKKWKIKISQRNCF